VVSHGVKGQGHTLELSYYTYCGGNLFHARGPAATVNDVISAIRRLPDKSCAADTLPTPQLKLVADLIAPFLTLFNRSLSTATVPSVFKAELNTPLLKKTDTANYRSSQSNAVCGFRLRNARIARNAIPCVSCAFRLRNARNAIGCVACVAIRSAVVSNLLYDYLGLTFCPVCSHRTHHPIETAVLTDILYAVDESDLSVLALLDLSAVFDTVDHNILLTRLTVSYGMHCTGSSTT